MRNDEIAAEMSRHDAERRIADGWHGRRTCCPNAEVVQCVCRISVKCPTHGLICVGTHD